MIRKISAATAELTARHKNLYSVSPGKALKALVRLSISSSQNCFLMRDAYTITFAAILVSIHASRITYHALEPCIFQESLNSIQHTSHHLGQHSRRERFMQKLDTSSV